MRTSIIGALLAVCLLLTTAAQAATTWECYVYNPLAKQPSVDAVIRMIDEIKQKTNGDLLINLHLGGSLPIKAESITDLAVAAAQRLLDESGVDPATAAALPGRESGAADYADRASGSVRVRLTSSLLSAWI